MKICKLDFKKDSNGVLMVESSSYDIGNDEMKERVSTPLAMLTLRRIAVRNSKNYDKTLLSKEIGTFD